MRARPSLQLFDRADGLPLFSADGKWLHPLFELEEWLVSHPQQSATLFLRDKIIGKAAAVLLLSMGIRHCHGCVMSAGAITILKRFGARYSYDVQVERIGCRTEVLIDESAELEASYTLLRERWERVRTQKKVDFPPSN